VDKIAQAIKKIGRILLNYIKLFLIPFVFVFMILALLVKGIKVLAKKIILNRE
jgi:Na+/H+-dicarboxylate symporter